VDPPNLPRLTTRLVTLPAPTSLLTLVSVPSFLRPSGSRYVHPLRTSDAREPSLRREDGDMRREADEKERGMLGQSRRFICLTVSRVLPPSPFLSPSRHTPLRSVRAERGTSEVREVRSGHETVKKRNVRNGRRLERLGSCLSHSVGSRLVCALFVPHGSSHPLPSIPSGRGTK